jgi:hypothetical protein
MICKKTRNPMINKFSSDRDDRSLIYTVHACVCVVKGKEKQGSNWTITKARRFKGWKLHVNTTGND